MMGKAFFGKLINNRQEPGPEDHADPKGGHSAVDLDVAPDTEEDAHAISSVGGDGQSAQLPDVSPTPVSDHLANEEAAVPAHEMVHNQDTAGAYGDSSHTSDIDGHHAADADDAPVDSSHFAGSSDYIDDFDPLSDEDDHDGEPDYISLDDFVIPEEFESDAYADDSYSAEESDETPSDSWSVDSYEDVPAPADSLDSAEIAPAEDAAQDYVAHGATSHEAASFETAPHEGSADDAAAREAAAAAAREAAAAAAREVAAAAAGREAAAAAAAREAAARRDAPPAHEAPPPHTEMPHHTQIHEAAPSPLPLGSAQPLAEDRAGPHEPNMDERAAAPPRTEAPPPSESHQQRQAGENGSAAPAPAAGREREAPGKRPKPSRPAHADADLRGIKDRVVIRLLDKQLVSPEHVKAALGERNKSKLKATLWRIVAHQKGVNRDAIYREAALTYAFVERKLEEKEVDLEFVRQVADVFPEKRRNRLIELRVVPIGYEFEQQTQMLRVVFLTHDPSLPAVRELMQELNLERYELQYAPEQVVKDLLAKAFPRKNEYLERMSDDPLAYDLGLSYEDEKGELIDEEALEAEINRSSLINLFEAALVESVLKGASDIHIYPNAKRQVEIHFRIDGRLSLWHIEDKVHPESLLAVIKDNTMNVDRFERDMAQDGFIQRKVDDTLIRYRVSILPIASAQQSLHAESIVIRVLDDRKVLTDLSKLGLLKGALERFDMAIRQPHGMVILTGPTGSGKSTTLVAALHQVVDPEINVLTVEDPVEYIIPGVRQIKLNHKLDLEQALRSILRHDPDVVMVGEMRDRPTAELAIKLANTGHLTFSTLHTNDAPSAVSRLYKMGVEPFLIAYAINLVVAQRLIRALCPDCKVVDRDPDPVLLDRLGFTKEDLESTTLYKASGDPTCKKCKGTGYKGRRAISEALYFSRAIRHLIVEADQKIDEDALREAAKEEGMLTLQDSAREVVKMGMTSVDEMMRVTATEE